MRASVQRNCLTRPLVDVDPEKAGVQPACVVTEIVGEGPSRKEMPMPACAEGGPVPCWREQADETCGARVAIEVDRGGGTPALGTQLDVKCRACARDSAGCGAPAP